MLIVIGGHSRNIGKTSTAAAIIRSTLACQWVAVKISAHRHGSRDGAPFVLNEEYSRAGCRDSARFLAAGAARSFWLRASDQHLTAAMPALLALHRKSSNVIIESNRVLAHLTPDLYIAVLDYTVDDFKESARRFFCRADAYVVARRGKRTPCWRDVPTDDMARKPAFEVSPPGYENAGLVKFVEAAMLPKIASRLPLEPLSTRIRIRELTSGA
jgi:hypothetical protein